MATERVNALSDVLVTRLQARGVANAAGLVPGATQLHSFRLGGWKRSDPDGAIVVFHSYLAVQTPGGTARCYDHPTDGWMIGLEGEPPDLSRLVAETNFITAWDKAQRTHDQLWAGSNGRAVRDQTSDRQTYRKPGRDLYVALDTEP